MQKLINVLAVASFIVSSGVVAGGTYLYLNKDAIIEDIKEKAIKEATSMLPSLLPIPQLGGADNKPELPGASIFLQF